MTTQYDWLEGNCLDRDSFGSPVFGWVHWETDKWKGQTEYTEISFRTRAIEQLIKLMTEAVFCGEENRDGFVCEKKTYMYCALWRDGVNLEWKRLLLIIFRWLDCVWDELDVQPSGLKGFIFEVNISEDLFAYVLE